MEKSSNADPPSLWLGSVWVYFAWLRVFHWPKQPCWVGNSRIQGNSSVFFHLSRYIWPFLPYLPVPRERRNHSSTLALQVKVIHTIIKLSSPFFLVMYALGSYPPVSESKGNMRKRIIQMMSSLFFMPDSPLFPRIWWHLRPPHLLPLLTFQLRCPLIEE